jgi:hypothetical protein
MSENSLHALLIGLAILFSPFLFIQVFRWLQLSRARSNKHVTIKRTTKIGLLVSGLIQNRLKVLSKYPVGAPIYISFGKIIRYGFSSQEKGFRYLTAELSLWKFLWILFIPISLGGPERQMKDYLEREGANRNTSTSRAGFMKYLT